MIEQTVNNTIVHCYLQTIHVDQIATIAYKSSTVDCLSFAQLKQGRRKMNTLHISGLAQKPEELECSMRVLGDPRYSDPSAKENISELEELVAVSPNGHWMALRRKGSSQEEINTISRTDEGSEEIVVPMNFGWGQVCARDIADDGTLLFQAELTPLFDDLGFARRPIVFTPENKKLFVLPPEYKEEEWLSGSLPTGRPKSHTPHCYASERTVFGWTHVNYDGRREANGHNISHCVWRHQETGEWVVEYMPKITNSKWLWPASTGTFIWCDRPNRDSVVRFGLFDGTSMATFDDVSIMGHGVAVLSVAKDSTFLGNFCVGDGRQEKSEEGESELSCYAFLVRPHTKEIHVFNEFGNNPFLYAVSANGQYVIGSQPDVGYSLMKLEGNSYRYVALTARDWRIEDVTDVTDEGHVFAVATCTERKHDCFRLKLPVLLIPQW